uniref:Solute carrier family 37 member 1 n=1 Tax=Poecilia latipinna TaxID=48699 RepID=A0A3B3VUP3_9TELE
MAPVPPGIHLLVSFNREQWYRGLTFMLTFLLYTSFHLSRKPISIVKSELHKNCSTASELAAASGAVASGGGQEASFPSPHTETQCSWKPFDKSNYKQLLGAMDYSFLCAYAIGMYLSGIIGERLPIRLYLTVGMLSSGLFTCLFGLGYIYNIHSLGFYIFVQVANGLVQTTGWPSVVTCIGNWFGKGRRGLIMGLWNSHTSVGNILGSLIAGYWVSSNWGLSFIVPGLIIAAMGVVCFLFLIERKSKKFLQAKSWSGANGHPKVYLQYKDNKKQNYDTELLLPRDAVCVPAQPVVVVKSESEPSAISFMGALRIPGVVEFSLCLLFAKLVSYTFLFWLPLYITKAAHLDAKKAGDLSTLFDVGGIVGHKWFHGKCFLWTLRMLLVCGGLVNGPYALITTAVSADLGTHKSLKGNARALSTVTAIIDGTGSVGAALGPLLAGVLSAGGWNQVFYMLMTADFLALLLLLRLVAKELSSSKSHPVSAIE